MAASFVVRMRDGTVLEDIAGIAMDKRIKRRLNRPAECTFRVPSYMVNEIQSDNLPLICSGYRQLSVSLDATGLFFHGIIWNVEDEGDEDMVYSRVTAYDPMVVWRYRPARDAVDSYTGTAGNFSDPSFIVRNKTGPQIMEEILEASERLQTMGPDDAEGQLFLDLATSTYATGGTNLEGAPTNWPMTIAEIATLLTNTGELDIVIEPIIGGVGATLDPGTEAFQNIGRVHCYNGRYGTNRQATVHFDYATGDFNVRTLRRSEDMSIIGNKNWYYLGPRKDQQHWQSNVTGDHPGLDGPSFGPKGWGGDITPIEGPLGQRIFDSRAALGVFMNISIYDNFGSNGSSESSAYPLFLAQWQVETLLRTAPRQMVYVTPVRNGEFGVGDFDIGDTVTVNVGDKARVASSGFQRIYAYTVEIDDDAVEALGEFEASPDQDSI